MTNISVLCPPFSLKTQGKASWPCTEWESAWGTLWRGGHSCNGKGNHLCLLRRGQQVLFYNYGSVCEQKDSGREGWRSSWLRALWLRITCYKSYRNKSSTPCLCWWVLSSHRDKLTPDWISWVFGFFSTSCMCLNIQNSRGFPDQSHSLGCLLSSSPWNCRLLNLVVGIFTLLGCLLIHPKDSLLMSFFPPSPVPSHFPQKTLSVNQRKGMRVIFDNVTFFLIFFSPQKHCRNNCINFFLSHSKKSE